MEMYVTIGAIIVISLIVLIIGRMVTTASEAEELRLRREKAAESRRNELTSFPETEKKIRRLQEKRDRLIRELEEEKERERQYNRLKADLEDMEHRMAILQRIIDEEENAAPEDPAVDRLRDINMN